MRGAWLTWWYERVTLHSLYLGGQICGEDPLAILGFDPSFLVEHLIYLAPLTFIHGVGCLGINTWIDCMHLVDHLLFLDGCCGAFS